MLNIFQDGKNGTIFTELLDTMAVKASSQRCNAIGIIGNANEMNGKFYESWQNAMAPYEFQLDDISFSIEYLMAAKDECELNAIRMACQTTVDLFESLTEHIFEVINAENVSLTYRFFHLICELNTICININRVSSNIRNWLPMLNKH